MKEGSTSVVEMTAQQQQIPSQDASEVLAAALEQMDDILIAGTGKDYFADGRYGLSSDLLLTSCKACESMDIVGLVEKLRVALQNTIADTNDNNPLPEINYDDAKCVYEWLAPAVKRGIQGNTQNYEDLQQKVCQLESEKEQLMLQANVLSEQVEAQNEKICELESNLKDTKDRLYNTEAMLRKEMDSRSVIESGKLDLMTQVSSLRLKLSSAEQERQEFEDRINKLESELVLTSACLAEKDADIATLKSKITCNGTVNAFSEHDSETQKLKNALSSVIAANDEKERKIQDLRISLNRYKKLQELVLSNQERTGFDEYGTAGFTKGPLQSASALDLIMEVDGKADEDGRLKEKPPPFPRPSYQPLATSSPARENIYNREVESLRCSPILNSTSNSLPTNFSSSLSLRTRSTDNVSPPSKTPPAKRHYGTMPRQHGTDVLLQIQQQLQQHKVESSSQTASLDRSLRYAVKRSSQSSQSLNHPGLETFRPIRTKTSGFSFALQKVELDQSSSRCSLSPLATNRRSSSPMSGINNKEKPRGIKRIFVKLRRTGSENLNNNAAEFKRGGVRATAGPRLGWPLQSKNFDDLSMPFAQWDGATIADWLHSIGLGMYGNDCKKSVKSGEQLLKATNSDLEKLLGIKNVLHRKKLLLAVTGAKGKDAEKLEPYGKLDFHWIIRWLDDIGLPQYKDAFFEARIDGSVLHHLTVEDLFHLKVNNQLHHISIKRGIQVLRENTFNSQCLKRRFLPGDEQTPSEVSKWTNHRVMEWLRTVDLSEYAPNLRGSGVHGALMVYEQRFNADLLATLLNIPPNKTLLRRHLSTQFKQLVGCDLMQKKREWESQTSYSPLSPSAKVKVVRRSHLSLIRKRNKGEVDFDDYVCPMDITDSSGTASSTKNISDPKLKRKQNPKTVQASSPKVAENNCEDKILSSVLEDHHTFESMPATNV